MLSDRIWKGPTRPFGVALGSGPGVQRERAQDGPKRDEGLLSQVQDAPPANFRQALADRPLRSSHSLAYRGSGSHHGREQELKVCCKCP
jgi:hypothetical protein